MTHYTPVSETKDVSQCHDGSTDSRSISSGVMSLQDTGPFDILVSSEMDLYFLTGPLDSTSLGPSFRIAPHPSGRL